MNKWSVVEQTGLKTVLSTDWLASCVGCSRKAGKSVCTKMEIKQMAGYSSVCLSTFLVECLVISALATRLSCLHVCVLCVVFRSDTALELHIQRG